MYTSPKAMAKFSALSWPETVRLAGLPKEVLAVVHLAVLGAGRVLQVQGGHPEHLAGALAVEAVMMGVWT